MSSEIVPISTPPRRLKEELVVRSLLLGLVVTLAGWTIMEPSTTNAAIHEIAAAYCSGGGHGVIDENGFVEPTPLEDAAGTSPSAGHAFAKPVLSSGAVEVVFPNVLITDKPNTKFEEGTVAVNLVTGTSGMGAATAEHPSAAHCPKNALP